MNTVYVAYNGYGDLVAVGYSYSELLDAIIGCGYEPGELLIGRVTP